MSEAASSRPVRIVQTGMGGFGRSWAAQVIPSVPGAELVACVDIDPAALELTRALVPIPPGRCFTALDEALAEVECDAVLITNVAVAHIPSALTALAQGKHVLVEKPFAPTLDDARKAVAAAQEAGRMLMVSQNYRHFPAVRGMQQLVAGGEYGAPSAVHIDFRRYDNAAPRGEHRHYQVPEPMLMDMAIHHFDLMRAVLGQEPVEIDCRSWNPPWSKFDEPAAADATIVFADGAVVSYRGSWLSPGVPTPWAGEWRLEFSEVEVAWTSRAGGQAADSEDVAFARRLGGRRRRIELPALTYTDRSGSLSAFMQAIASGAEPETSGRNNIPSLALTLAAIESAATGAPVRLA